MLKQIGEAAQQNANYILGGVVVVALVLVIGLMVQRRQAEASARVWSEINEIRNAAPEERPQRLDQARALADEYGDDKSMGPEVLSLYGQLLYNKALDLTDPEDKSQRVDALKQAKGVFERMIANFAQRKNVLDPTRMMLASIEESLVIAGEGDRGRIETLYKKVIDGGNELYTEQAESLLKDLDDRLTPITIVEAPPEPEPAPQPPSDLPPGITLEQGGFEDDDSSPADPPVQIELTPTGDAPMSDESSEDSSPADDAPDSSEADPPVEDASAAEASDAATTQPATPSE